MAGRRPALQWRKLARQNCLRGRAARYVAAAALCLVAACGCCLATLLPLTTLLGVLAAVLLPSFLRCVQLRHVPDLLRQEVLLLEFVQRVPYCYGGIENRVAGNTNGQVSLVWSWHLFRRICLTPGNRGTAGVGDSVVLARSWTCPKSVWLCIERQLVALSSLSC